MKLPSVSRMLGPVTETMTRKSKRNESIRTVDRIGLVRTFDGDWKTWSVVFEDEPHRYHLSSMYLPHGSGQDEHIALARRGDRLRMVVVDGKLIEVENLDLPKTA